MAWHLYVVPGIGDGSKTDARRPKYIADADPPVSFNALGYGFQPVYMVAADVSDPQDATLSGLADVRKVPDNLDSNPSAAGVTVVANFLETLNVPAGWVTTALTWRQITRTVAGLFLFAQRLRSFLGNVRLVEAGVTLDTRFNQLPQATRQALTATAESFGYDTSSLGGTSTVRQILKVMADQWAAKPIHLGGITL